MTNILAVISIVVSTNWITTHVDKAQCNIVGCLVVHLDGHHQIREIVTNTVATMEWNGVKKHCVLDFRSSIDLSKNRLVYIPDGGKLPIWDNSTNFMSWDGTNMFPYRVEPGVGIVIETNSSNLSFKITKPNHEK